MWPSDDHTCPRRCFLLLFAVSCLNAGIARAWTVPSSIRRLQQFQVNILPSSTTSITLRAASTSNEEATDTTASPNEGEVKPSFYQTQEVSQRGRPIWKERKQLSELKVGDALDGFVVQEHLEGTTGPKVFLEVGVGKYDSKKRTWKMANAMLRLGRRGAKASVTKKRVARLKKKESIECFVSRIRLANRQLEVVLNSDQVPDADAPRKVSVTALIPGQEVVGTVQRLVPYGAFVDVGANREGLLHIQKVADLYGSYIDKEKGLKVAGLERGAKIKVQIESNEKKRVFLDFTREVKAEAEKEEAERQRQKEERQQQKVRNEGTGPVAGTEANAGAVAAVSSDSSAAVSASTDSDVSQEADAWAAYAEYQNDDSGSEDDDDDDYDGYDEDRDIEDALGLGTY